MQVVVAHMYKHQTLIWAAVNVQVAGSWHIGMFACLSVKAHC